MLLPIRPVERPLDLIGVDNGRLDSDLLVTVPGGGRLHHLAARAWCALVAAAAVAGYNLTYTPGGCYRTYAQQETLFKQRYAPSILSGRPTKTWQGAIWSLKPGMATAAVPGTSNHGLGLAIDSALDNDPGDGISPNDATSIAPALAWLVENAADFGFSWELQSEAWHVRYVTGDDAPPAVLAYENPPAAPHPNPSNPVEGDDMAEKLKFIGVEGSPGQYLWRPGIEPIALVNPTQRDLMLAMMDVDPNGTTISPEQFNQLH